jgi:hypothetical protein
MYEHHTSPLLPFRDFLFRMARHFGVVVALILVSLAAGIVGYHALGGLRWVDSFLNAAMILGGMGPVDELHNDPAKIFAGCYALYSGLVLIAVAGIMIAPVAHRLLHKLHVEDE